MSSAFTVGWGDSRARTASSATSCAPSRAFSSLASWRAFWERSGSRQSPLMMNPMVACACAARPHTPSATANSTPTPLVMPAAFSNSHASQGRMPRLLGDVRLRYDAELLIGECVPALDAAALIPDLLLLGGLASGVLARALLVIPALRGGSVWGTMGAAAASAAGTIAGLRMRGRRRWRRGFVVNFDLHLARVAEPRGLRTWSETTSLPFGEVESVQVVDRAGGWSALQLSAQGR